mmetsp:Transcript_24760/g.27717  ORF Transcript_24760/g.27717 Transcript_24760/m.27717 type:complete len:160 (-) Transcript_24760:537-1016(-)
MEVINRIAVGGTEDFDNCSISSLRTVPISNKSNILPDVNRMAEKVLHKDSEQDIHTIDTTPTHLVGSVHKSVFSDLTASSDEALDPDLQDQLDDLKKEFDDQKKGTEEKAAQTPINEHQVHEKQNKKHRDDDPDDNGGKGGKYDAKPPVTAADAVVTTK